MGMGFASCLAVTAATCSFLVILHIIWKCILNVETNQHAAISRLNCSLHKTTYFSEHAARLTVLLLCMHSCLEHLSQDLSVKEQLQQHAVLCCTACVPHFCLICTLQWGNFRQVSLATMLQEYLFVIQGGNTLEATLALVWDTCVWCPSDPSSTCWQAGRLAGVSIMPPWLRCAWPLSAFLTPLLLAVSSTDLPRSVCCLLHTFVCFIVRTSTWV